MKRYESIFYFFFLHSYILRAFLVKLFASREKPVKNSVYFFSPFFAENAGYHWRVDSWKNELHSEGFNVKIGTATSKEEFYKLFPAENIKFQKAFLKRRFKQILESRSSEIVIVRREVLLFNDYGNLFLQKLLLHFHPNAILDFDDDIAASKGQPKKIENFYGNLMLENGNKFNSTLRLFQNFIPATNHLKERVLSENPSVKTDDICIIPTCVDYQKHSSKLYQSGNQIITLGWIGSTGNYFLLDELLPSINRLSEEFEVELLVIGGEEYVRETSFPIRFEKWSLENEIDNLYQIDIGLMPLVDNDISRGKAGFKLIQYMALGIVSVASAITVNKEIIPSEDFGYLVKDSWLEVLRKAMLEKEKWKTIGPKGREHVLSNYTIQANKKIYLDFISHIQNKTKGS